MNQKDTFVSKSALDNRQGNRARLWRLRARTLELDESTLLMGIINVTPDSFSDGGQFLDHKSAIDHGLQLVDQGADILDIGGESTRPYAIPIEEREELHRVIPVVQAMCERVTVPISIDTSTATVAKEAIAAGAEVINDVTGLEGDPQMLSVALESGAGVCAMHMQGTPQSMQDNPQYKDVVEDIFVYLQQRRDALMSAGVDFQRICLDPGIGFGKTHQHNITLLAHCHRYLDLGCPVLVGHSRKGFIGKVLGDKEVDRLAGTVGVALSLASQRVHIIRIHDVRVVREALSLFKATGGMGGSELRLD